jgi:hypothetical protein
VPDFIGLFVPTFDALDIFNRFAKNRHEEIHLQTSFPKTIGVNVDARVIIKNKSMLDHLGFLSVSGFLTG